MKVDVVTDNAAVVDIDDGYYEKESIDTGNIAILQFHLPQLIGARYLGSFGQFARMFGFYFLLRKQHLQFLAQSVYLFMVNVQLIVLLHDGCKLPIAIRIAFGNIICSAF
jgi:hypothetical protein